MIIKGKEYEINRETARVTEWDKIYCDILKDTIKRGDFYPNRTGIDTLAIPNIAFDLNVGKEFPILETKKVAIKNTITELLWIYQAQTNDIRWLQERGNHVWDDWMIDKDGIYRTYEPFEDTKRDIEVVVKDVNNMPIKLNENEVMKAKSLNDKTIKSATYFGEEYAFTDGTAYGDVVKKTDQMNILLNLLKNDPYSRRMILSLRQNNYLKTGVLEPCVWASTYMYYKKTLNSNVNVRSNDMPIGNPFNVSQYAVLLSLLAKVSEMEVGQLHWDISNCHIYVNQLKEIKTQLQRFDKLQEWEEYIKTHTDDEIEREYSLLLEAKEAIDKKKKINKKFESDYEEVNSMITNSIICLEHLITRKDPSLYIADKKDFYAFDNKKENDDIKVLNYTSLPAIKMPVAQ